MRSFIALCFVLLLAAAGCLVPVAAQAADDEAVARAVALRLAEDAELSSAALTIGVRDGGVVLHGTVGAPQQRERAEAVARAVDGVVRVENRILVRATSSLLGAPGTPQLVSP